MRDGAPVGGVQELTYAKGDQVRIKVKLDEPQEDVHIHGYEIESLNPTTRGQLRLPGQARGDLRARGARPERRRRPGRDPGGARLADAPAAPALAAADRRRAPRRGAAAPAAGRGPRARRQAGPADPGLAVRLGRLDRPDRLLRRALDRLAQPAPAGGALAPGARLALGRAAEPGRRGRSRARSGSCCWASRVYAGLEGTEAPDRNFALTFVFVTFWLGLVAAQRPLRRRLPRLQPLAGDRRAFRRRVPAGRRPVGAAAAALSGAARPLAGGRRDRSASSGWSWSTAPASASG